MLVLVVVGPQVVVDVEVVEVEVVEVVVGGHVGAERTRSALSQ